MRKASSPSRRVMTNAWIMVDENATSRVLKRTPPYPTSQVRLPTRYHAGMPKALLVAVLLAPVALAPTQSSDPLLEHARKLHSEVPLIDGHNDYVWELRTRAQRDFKNLDISKPQPAIMTDIPRLRAGGVGGQFWSVYVPVELTGQSAVTATLEEIDTVHRLVRQYPETFELALTADDIERIF